MKRNCLDTPHPSWSAALFHPQGLTIWPTGALIHSPHSHWRGIIIVPLFPRWKPCHISNPHYTRNYLDTPHPSWSAALFYPQGLIICPTGAINDPSLLLTPVVLRSQLCFSLAIYVITSPSLLLTPVVLRSQLCFSLAIYIITNPSLLLTLVVLRSQLCFSCHQHYYWSQFITGPNPSMNRVDQLSMAC